MCTLILLDRMVPGAPVVVAANRDEFFARPAAPPALFEPPARPAYAAPHDLEAGGTWMGVNARGLFVGLTNRPTEQRDAARRSRGLLVVDALARWGARAVVEALPADPPRVYNPFHLLAADGRESWLVVSGDASASTRRLEPGVHVIGNLDEADPSSDKLGRIRSAVQRIPLDRDFRQIREDLVAVLGDHSDEDSAFENACVHAPDYGTRSAAIIALGPERRAYWSADGPPCRAKFHDYTRLLHSLEKATTSEGIR